MGRNTFAPLNNADGFSLRWVNSGTGGRFKVLNTGVYSWAGHFSPASGRVAASAFQRFGAPINAQLITDYDLEFNVGNTVVISHLLGEDVDQRYEIAGIDKYPSRIETIRHQIVYLRTFKQGSIG